MLRVLSLHLQELSAVKVRKSGTGASPRAAAKPRTRSRARGAAGMLTSPALGRLARQATGERSRLIEGWGGGTTVLISLELEGICL